MDARANQRAQSLGKAVDDSSQYFVTEITIGTPPQRFSVALSIDSAALSVPDSSCIPRPFCFQFCFKSLFCKALCPSACCDPAAFPPTPEGCGASSNIWDCGDRHKFNRLKSSTYNDKLNGVWFCEGADLTDARSFVGIDTVRMGDGFGKQLAIQNATFGEIYVEASESYEWFDGEFGIGAGTASIPTGYTPPILSAYKQGLIKDPIATLWLNSTHAEYALNKTDPNVGKLSIGGLNTQNCGKIAEWHPIYKPERYSGLQLTLEKMSLGNASISVGLPAFVGLEGNDDLDRIVGGKPLADIAKAAGATSHDGTSTLRIACNATFPPLRIQFGKTEYVIPSKDLINNYGEDYCTLKIDIQSWQDDMVDTLVTLNPNYCYSVDVGKNLVGFASNLD
ncbi:aspartic protease 2B [Aphelenchoides avenae]|nr:aspartic protease 2B [Aphelenchus avenae]